MEITEVIDGKILAAGRVTVVRIEIIELPASVFSDEDCKESILPAVVVTL